LFSGNMTGPADCDSFSVADRIFALAESEASHLRFSNAVKILEGAIANKMASLTPRELVMARVRAAGLLLDHSLSITRAQALLEQAVRNLIPQYSPV
jgi:hypothetical protein